MLRCPISISRIVSVNGDGQVLYKAEKAECQSFPRLGSETLRRGAPRNFEVFDPLEFLAEITQHIPETGMQTVRYYGWYSNKMRGQRAAESQKAGEPVDIDADQTPAPSQSRMRWAALMKRVFEVDPLECPECLPVPGEADRRRGDEDRGVHRSAGPVRADRADPQTLRPVAAPGLPFAPRAVPTAGAQTAEHSPVPRGRSGVREAYLKKSHPRGVRGEGVSTRAVVGHFWAAFGAKTARSCPKTGRTARPAPFVCIGLRKMLQEARKRRKGNSYRSSPGFPVVTLRYV
jgi:hypothetical protein